ncbi:hypothetical protein [Ruminococcus flavefaciens]|uniref:hypothetical protein n=1 Tax=Ruminococcus flavefaciens TaxID=1265 RepID=UPI0004907EF2|nr:hypothetical protein [Ruminococcus flavefaciens]
MLKIKKAIITVSALATLATTGALLANAAWDRGGIQATCRVNESWIPFTNDTAMADGCTNYGLDVANGDISRLWLRRTINAWNKDDYKTNSNYYTDNYAFEGWYSPTVKLRNITYANAYFSANITNSWLPTCYAYDEWYE